jgi:hypothetical protein
MSLWYILYVYIYFVFVIVYVIVCPLCTFAYMVYEKQR